MTIQSPGYLALAAVAFVLLGVGLVFCVISLVRGNRDDVLASVPVVGEFELTLASSGEVVVMIEAPRMTTEYRAFQIQLLEKQSGQVSTLNYSMLPAQGAVYGVTTVQVPFGRIQAKAGDYFARVLGLRPGVDYSNFRLILSRPYLGRMALQIIGIVFCGVGMLGSLIWACWLAGLMKQSA